MIPPPYDVFVSYNSHDREAATPIATALKHAGLRVWFDRWQLRPGRTWQDDLPSRMRDARAVVLLIGPSGIGTWQAPEIRTALQSYMRTGNPVIPVILPGVSEVQLPDLLDQHTYVDCRMQELSSTSLNQLILGITGRRTTLSVSQFGESFLLPVTTRYGHNKLLRIQILPNIDHDRLLNLSWETFGEGIEHLIDQIKNPGSRVLVNACFGINEAGLVMATFINSSTLGNVPLGHIRCGRVQANTVLLEESYYPNLDRNPCIMICDFEIKRADVLGVVINHLRMQYSDPSFYFAVFGAMTEESDLRISSLDQLVSSSFLSSIELEDIFIASTMSPPGIEPPLGLR
ncbi:MAG: toll/interleukin-1 receptor domain-containing protein [Chloroflexota bacterium]